MKIHALWLSASVLALGWGGLAHAQTNSDSSKASDSATVQELVVTAERRNENLQTTPIAATEVSTSRRQPSSAPTSRTSTDRCGHPVKL